MVVACELEMEHQIGGSEIPDVAFAFAESILYTTFASNGIGAKDALVRVPAVPTGPSPMAPFDGPRQCVEQGLLVVHRPPTTAHRRLHRGRSEASRSRTVRRD